MKKFRKYIYILIGIVCIPVIFLVISNMVIIKSTKSRIYTNINDLPINEIGLVLGTSKYATDGLNLFYKYRMEAAADLYLHGKIKHIIVSGDNHINGYNEPEQMKASLVQLGVPAERITCDYAGLRTLDSMVRLKKIFMVHKATIISQRFHLERALFIASYYNIDAIGYCSKDVGEAYGRNTNIREVFARSKAVLDLYILHTKPKHMGPEVKIEIP
jgi:SanA protein